MHVPRKAHRFLVTGVRGGRERRKREVSAELPRTEKALVPRNCKTGNASIVCDRGIEGRSFIFVLHRIGVPPLLTPSPYVGFVPVSFSGQIFPMRSYPIWMRAIGFVVQKVHARVCTTHAYEAGLLHPRIYRQLSCGTFSHRKSSDTGRRGLSPYGIGHTHATARPK